MLRNWIKSSGNIYFLTNTVRHWLPVLVYQSVIDAIFATWELYRRKHHLEIYAYTILPHHLHYLAWLPPGDFNLSALERDFKKYIGRQVHDALRSGDRQLHPFFANTLYTPIPKIILRMLSIQPRKRNHCFALWKNNTRLILIFNKAIYRQKYKYIILNPVRAGWVTDPSEYPLSSIYTLGKPGLIVNPSRYNPPGSPDLSARVP